MAFSLFSSADKTAISDNLFIKVIWDSKLNPESNKELSNIIQSIDAMLPESSFLLEETLPFLTFYQAAVLFDSLKRRYQEFTFQEVTICHKDGNKVISAGEAKLSPFVIDANYQELLSPLMRAVITQKEFQKYTFDNKRRYFTDQVFPQYIKSLSVNGFPIDEGELPDFPELTEKEQEEAKKVAEALASESLVKNKRPTSFWLGGSAIGVGLLSLALGFASVSKIKSQEAKITYLHDQLTVTKQVQADEHQVDTFSRYFLSAYYSNNKDTLKPFLDKGDARYTAPKDAMITSTILEGVSYDDQSKTYNLTYVLGLKTKDDTKQSRLTFKVKENKKSDYGFVLTAEPTEKTYPKDKSN
ncbi:hypothetical protein [Streptococcus sobrinus]|uniref:hypothetical protein n=1 Tax=Streptococcus sobrinus TaxID=1310 RepID=UPI0003035A00|nr:hypothetical protein [Streptococcus sobrinus]